MDEHLFVIFQLIYIYLCLGNECPLKGQEVSSQSEFRFWFFRRDRDPVFFVNIFSGETDSIFWYSDIYNL